MSGPTSGALSSQYFTWHGTLRDEDEERRFRVHHWPNTVTQLRIVATVATLFVALLSAADFLLLRDAPWIWWALLGRGVIVGVCVALPVMSLYRGPYLWLDRWLTATTWVVVSACLMVALARETAVYPNLLAIATATFSLYIILPLRFSRKVVPVTGLGVALLASMILMGRGTPYELVLATVYLTMLNVTAGAMARHIQVAQRTSFIRLMSEQRARRLAEQEAQERRDVAEALDLARLEAETADRAKTTFLATMSHEIRTPLNGILGMAELLLADEDGDTPGGELQAIFDSATALNDLLGDVLDLSRIQADAVTLAAAPFDIASVQRRAVSVISSTARSRGLVVESRTPDAPVTLVGDPVRIQQIVVNLLGNAAKFTPEGRIDVTSTIEGTPGGSAWLHIAVSDTGIGIAAEDLELVFERFRQVDDGYVRRAGGAGLGLAISRALAEEMGGVLGAESELGVGSCFTLSVLLPVADAATGEHAARSLMERRMSVLVVSRDDDAPGALEDLVTALGHRARGLPDANRLVDVASTTMPDLVLMDLDTPGVDGLAAIRRLRAAGITVPVVAVGRAAGPRERAASAAAGLDGLLAKPVSRTDVERVLCRWVADAA